MWGFPKSTSGRSDSLRYLRHASVTARTAVYGPVRTVVWQGSAGDCRPYADQWHTTGAIRLLHRMNPYRAAPNAVTVLCRSYPRFPRSVRWFPQKRGVGAFVNDGLEDRLEPPAATLRRE